MDRRDRRSRPAGSSVGGAPGLLVRRRALTITPSTPRASRLGSNTASRPLVGDAAAPATVQPRRPARPAAPGAGRRRGAPSSSARRAAPARSARRRRRRRRSPRARSALDERRASPASPRPGGRWCSQSSVAGSSRLGLGRSARAPAAPPARRSRAASACGTLAGSTRAGLLGVQPVLPAPARPARAAGCGSRRSRPRPPPALAPGDGQAAEQGGGGVVRVALDSAARSSSVASRHSASGRRDSRSASDHAGDDGRRRRPQPATVRDARCAQCSRSPGRGGRPSVEPPPHGLRRPDGVRPAAPARRPRRRPSIVRPPRRSTSASTTSYSPRARPRRRSPGRGWRWSPEPCTGNALRRTQPSLASAGVTRTVSPRARARPAAVIASTGHPHRRDAARRRP